ncbi:MAG TPA: ATP-binding cassette domain-containing protein [Thermodesulfobacteriota bacterium]|nr:ATP-binding cassette domain-containing protein [Thermodesulfobacteriota bacterium]
MIEFDEVGFSYGPREVLRNISFSVDFHEKVAILGESGEGKTTILKLIMGLLRPDSGKILIDGEDISVKTEDDLREIRMKFSIVFQEGALFDSLNVKENVAFGLREYTKLSEGELDQKVRSLLKMVDLENAAELMPEELSGGMHRRVAIIRSLAAIDPRMFLYDEPTSGLDPVNADIICRLILKLFLGGRGFIVVTHKIFDAFKLADRFMFLKNGTVLLDGQREKLVNSPLPEIQVFLSELNPGLEHPSMVNRGGRNG